MTATGPRPRLGWLGAALIAVGVGLRVAHMNLRPALFGDEAMLALSIARRDYGGLLLPLDHAQAASVPFLWLERLVVDLLGVSDWALRVPSLLGGLVLLWAVWYLAARCLPRTGALLALALIATSPYLIRYSGEIKPYGLDALTGTLFLLALLRWRAALDNQRAWLEATVIGVCCVLFSLPMIFIAAAAGIALAPNAWRARGAPGIPLRLLATGGLWLAAFALPYLALYRYDVGGTYMREFWEAAFLTPRGEHGVGLPIRYWSALRGLVSGPAYWAVSVDATLVLVILLAVGGWRMQRRRGARESSLLFLPVLVVWVASAFGAYPLAARMTLFLAPVVALALGEGLAALLVSAPVLPRVLGRSAVGLAGGLMIVTGWIWAMKPPPQEAIGPALEMLARERGPGESVYVFFRAVPAWAFHTTDWNAPDTGRVTALVRWSSPGSVGHENGPSQGPRIEGQPGLTLTLSAGDEILGISSGAQAREGQGYMRSRPDSGWARNEAQRIRSGAAPRTWLLLSNYSNASEGAELLAALAEVGGIITARSAAAPAAMLLAVTFPDLARPEPR